MSEEIRTALQGAAVAYVASADDRGQPHLAVSKLVRILDAEHVAFTAWFCPQTAENVAKNPKVAVSVWDATHDHGYQLVGEVTNATVTATLDGWPGPEREYGPISQEERRLTIRVDAVMELQVRHAHRQSPLTNQTDMAMANESLIEKLSRLKSQRRAVILAHNYQRPEVQDAADYVGDSLGLSRQAAGTKAEVILFCGVDFMAETAAILCPGRKVLVPDPRAGCPMANMVTARELRALKAQHPAARVVCYINSSAEVKAESDVCCTSANAVQVVRSLPADCEIIFVPDQSLGDYAAKQAGRKLILWPGYCPTHHRILTADILRARSEHPGAKVVVHPECTADVIALADHVASTTGILKLCQSSPAKEFIIGTEIALLHRLREGKSR